MKDPKNGASDPEEAQGSSKVDEQGREPEPSPESVSRRDIFRGGLTSAVLMALGGLRPDRAIASELGADGLVLKMPLLQKRLHRLFQELERDGSTREAFIQYPADVLVRSLFPEQARSISDQEFSEANRLLFSVLANDEFRTWADNYNRQVADGLKEGRIKPEDIDKKQVLQDLAQALAQYGDRNIFLGMLDGHQKALRERDNGEVQDTFFVEVETAVYGVFVVAVAVVAVLAVIDITPATNPTNGIASLFVSSSELRSLSEQLIHRSRELSSSGKLADLKASL